MKIPVIEQLSSTNGIALALMAIEADMLLDCWDNEQLLPVHHCDDREDFVS